MAVIGGITSIQMAGLFSSFQNLYTNSIVSEALVEYAVGFEEVDI